MSNAALQMRGPVGGTTDARKVAIGSSVGAVIETYDFIGFGTAAALYFGTAFFPTANPLTGTLAAFATLGVGFAARPLGGIIGGHLGDRVGRKPVLVLSLIVMGLATFAIGLLPTYESVGVAAPILLVTVRIIQGLAFGAEWGGAILMAYEHAPWRHKGRFTGIVQAGFPVGLLLANLVFLFSVHLGGSLAWRIPFLASIVLVGVGLFIRLRIAEPPAFRDLVANDARAKVPLLEVVRRHPRTTLLAMGARMSESVTFNVYNAFLVTYVVTVLGLANTVALNALMVAAVVGFAMILLAGRLSDRVGRRPVFMAGALVAAVSAFPVFALLDTENAALITLAVVIGWAFGACTMFGAEGVMFAELFPTRVRYSGMSTVYQLGVLPSGAVAPVICTLLVRHFGQAWPVATYVLVMALVTLVSLVLLPETFRGDLRSHETSSRVPHDEQVSA